MKSAIYSELSKATGVTFKGGNEQEFFSDLVKAVANLKDPEWDKLSEAAQDWFNAGAKAKNKKEDIVGFPDLEEETQTRSRRRSGDDDDGGKAKPKEAEVGSQIVGVTARGKEIKGKVVEIDGDILVIDDGSGGDLIDFNPKTCKSLDVIEPEAEQPRGRRRAAEEPEEPEEPKLDKGDRAVLVTKRGKEIVGKIVEIDDKGFLLKGDDGEEYDYEFDAIKSLLPEKGGKKTEEEGTRTRSRSSAKAEDDKGGKAEDGARTRSSNDKGVSIGTRIRELIAEADGFDISEEAIAKVLKKEGIDFKENTLSLNYKESMKFIDILKAAKRLK